MVTIKHTPNKPVAQVPPDGEKMYGVTTQNYPPDTAGVRFTLTDLANACRLARVDFPTFLRLRAYLPVSNQTKTND